MLTTHLEAGLPSSPQFLALQVYTWGCGSIGAGTVCAGTARAGAPWSVSTHSTGCEQK